MRLGDSDEPNSSPFEVSTDQLALIEAGQDRNGTPFDYLIIGSGAGGGPLAVRLALAPGRPSLVPPLPPAPAGAPDSHSRYYEIALLQEKPIYPETLLTFLALRACSALCFL
jgi:hypothetical protein